MKNIIKKIIQHFIPSLRPQVSNSEQRRLGICINYRIPTKSNLVAITFDDGPSENVNPAYLDTIKATTRHDPDCTRKVLQVLEKHRAKATFFVCGEHIKGEGEVTLKAAHNAGHEIAVHCWHHGESVHRMTQPELIDELMQTKKRILEVTGTEPTCMRPPRGETDDVTTQLIFSHVGLRTILWQETAFDWLFYTPRESVDCILNTIAPGSIVLMHDLYEYTPETVDKLLEQLQKRGLKCVTVTELINSSTEAANYFPPPQR